MKLSQTFKWMVMVVWFWAGMLCMPGCHSAFFVDKGHIDVVNGVAFQIQPPLLFIKKAFHLRDQALSAAQLAQLSEAMPQIAAITDQVLGHARLRSHPEVSAKFLRSVRDILKLNEATPLYVKAIQNWQIQEATIEWTTDYFWTSEQGHYETFRDNYAIQRSADGWRFSGHPRISPEGRLTCTKEPSGRVQCGV
jgi:hypothetical protein